MGEGALVVLLRSKYITEIIQGQSCQETHLSHSNAVTEALLKKGEKHKKT